MMHKVPCPALCGRDQKAGMFLCRPCWTSLPVIEKASVNRTWEALNTIDPAKDSVAYLGALKAYRNARESALRWLAAHPNRTPVRQAAEDLFKGNANERNAEV